MSRSKIQNLQSPKGMHDILPQEQMWWDKVRKEVDYIADYYNFSRIDTAILERAEIFEKSLGETTDIVEKQMFVFKSRSGDRLALRPEGTASIVRSYVQHGLSHLGQPLKLFYIGPMFRKEQPQSGRFRQFHQAGFEIIGGDDDPVYDAQLILAIYRLLERFKIKNLSLHINSIGCRNCRPVYRKKLLDYYRDLAPKLCKDCRRRMKQNPLRLLDCKNEQCQQYKASTPMILDSLCSNCNKHFKGVLEFLEELKLSYQLDHHLVRGLDYYNRTAFEFFTDSVAEDGTKFDFALAGGGRYDYLLELFGSRQSSGVGGAVGMERVIEVMRKTKINLGLRSRQKVFFIHIGDVAKKKSLSLIEELRDAGIPVLESLGKDSLAAQLRSANKENADYALIFGQKEAFEDSIIVRDLKNGVQETVPLRKVVNEVKKRFK
ncbi:MAG: histidine--tRNA ligase [Candidatus Harrisonbacteria bacterium]|nr:histidine--tRNA ligase [Candidatus Harrisonbacteria bacterium]